MVIVDCVHVSMCKKNDSCFPTRMLRGIPYITWEDGSKMKETAPVSPGVNHGLTIIACLSWDWKSWVWGTGNHGSGGLESWVQLRDWEIMGLSHLSLECDQIVMSSHTVIRTHHSQCICISRHMYTHTHTPYDILMPHTCTSHMHLTCTHTPTCTYTYEHILQGFHPTMNTPHAKFTNYTFDVEEFMRLLLDLADGVIERKTAALSHSIFSVKDGWPFVFKSHISFTILQSCFFKQPPVGVV